MIEIYYKIYVQTISRRTKNYHYVKRTDHQARSPKGGLTYTDNQLTHGIKLDKDSQLQTWNNGTKYPSYKFTFGTNTVVSLADAFNVIFKKNGRVKKTLGMVAAEPEILGFRKPEVIKSKCQWTLKETSRDATKCRNGIIYIIVKLLIFILRYSTHIYSISCAKITSRTKSPTPFKWLSDE